jgi:hypothetical protein
MENAGASRLNYPTAVLMLDRYLQPAKSSLLCTDALGKSAGMFLALSKNSAKIVIWAALFEDQIACAVRSGCPPLPELLAVHRGHVAFRTCFRCFLGKVHLRFTILHFHQRRIERLSIPNRRIWLATQKTRQSHKGSASRLYRTAYRSGTTLTKPNIPSSTK